MWLLKNANEVLPGFYPIHFALFGLKSRNNNNPTAAVEMVQFLLECDPNVSSQKLHGNPLLYWACKLVGASNAGSKVDAAMKTAQVFYMTHTLMQSSKMMK